MRKYLLCKELGLSPLEYDRLDEKTVEEFDYIRGELIRREEHERRRRMKDG